MEFLFGLVLRYLLPAALLAGGLSFGVHKYNEGIRNEGRIEGRASADKEYKVEFDLLVNDFIKQKKQFNDLEADVISRRLAAKKAADDAIAKEKERAEFATRKYQDQVALVKRWQADRNDTLTVFDNLPDSMWSVEDVIACTDCSSGAGHLRISGYVSRLGKRYQSCERDLKTAIEAAGRAIDRAAERGAAVEALTRTPQP